MKIVYETCRECGCEECVWLFSGLKSQHSAAELVPKALEANDHSSLNSLSPHITPSSELANFGPPTPKANKEKNKTKK